LLYIELFVVFDIGSIGSISYPFSLLPIPSSDSCLLTPNRASWYPSRRSPMRPGVSPFLRVRRKMGVMKVPV